MFVQIVWEGCLNVEKVIADANDMMCRMWQQIE